MLSFLPPLFIFILVCPPLLRTLARAIFWCTVSEQTADLSAIDSSLVGFYGCSVGCLQACGRAGCGGRTCCSLILFAILRAEVWDVWFVSFFFFFFAGERCCLEIASRCLYSVVFSLIYSCEYCFVVSVVFASVYNHFFFSLCVINIIVCSSIVVFNRFSSVCVIESIVCFSVRYGLYILSSV